MQNTSLLVFCILPVFCILEAAAQDAAVTLYRHLLRGDVGVLQLLPPPSPPKLIKPPGLGSSSVTVTSPNGPVAPTPSLNLPPAAPVPVAPTSVIPPMGPAPPPPLPPQMPFYIPAPPDPMSTVGPIVAAVVGSAVCVAFCCSIPLFVVIFCMLKRSKKEASSLEDTFKQSMLALVDLKQSSPAPTFPMYVPPPVSAPAPVLPPSHPRAGFILVPAANGHQERYRVKLVPESDASSSEDETESCTSDSSAERTPPRQPPSFGTRRSNSSSVDSVSAAQRRYGSGGYAEGELPASPRRHHHHHRVPSSGPKAEVVARMNRYNASVRDGNYAADAYEVYQRGTSIRMDRAREAERRGSDTSSIAPSHPRAPASVASSVEPPQ